MKRYYNGFTLAEVVVCLVLIGVLAAVGLSVIKPNQINKKYQLSSLYHSLDQAYYNGIQNPEFNPFMYEGSNEKEPAIRLCKALTYFINGEGTKESDGSATSCNNGSFAPFDGNDDFFNNKNRKPYFTTLNGYDFFITKMHNSGFFIIYVDINGKDINKDPKGPNSVRYIKADDRIPDIYAFAALPIGRIVPLGIMEIDPRILTAYITYINPNEEQYTETLSGKNVPYYVAKSQAWGLYSEITDKNKLKEQDGNEAFTYNDFIRSELGNNCQIYKDITIPSIDMNNDDETIHFATKTDGTRVQVCDSADRSKCEVKITRYYY